MRRAPLVPAALALMVGILAACHLAWPAASWLWAIVASSLLIGLILLVNKRLHTFVIVPLLFFFAAIGGLLTTLQLGHDWTRHCPEQAYLEVRLTETPMPRERSWKAAGEVTQIDRRQASSPITLFFRRDSTAATLHYGDRLLLHGYPDTVRRTVYVTSDHYLVTAHDSTSLRARCEHLRLRLLRRMQNGPLAKREAGVAEALTIGWRGDIEPATTASFRNAGIAHLLAVSGLHVGLVAAIVGLLLFWIGKERRGRIVRGSIQLLAVWAFALLSGWLPATVRAALMFSLFIVANCGERRTPQLNLLAAAAIITLVANPLLIHDIGWQLSYSAVAGILLARPVITVFRNRLWQAATVSVAATLATLPVTVATFHRLPLYFLIANVVIIPLAGVLLFFALFYMALPCNVTAWCAALLVRATEGLTSWVASLPGAVVGNIDLSPWGLAALSIAVFALFLGTRIIHKYQNVTKHQHT